MMVPGSVHVQENNVPSSSLWTHQTAPTLLYNDHRSSRWVIGGQPLPETPVIAAIALSMLRKRARGAPGSMTSLVQIMAKLCIICFRQNRAYVPTYIVYM